MVAPERDGRVARLADEKYAQGEHGQLVWKALRLMLVGSATSRATVARELGVGEQQVDKWLTASTPNMPTASQLQALLTREDLVERPRRLEALSLLAREWGVEIVPIEQVRGAREMARPVVVQALAIDVQRRVGSLAAAIGEAVDPDSEHGESVSPGEALRIAEAAAASSSACRAVGLSARAQHEGIKR